MKECLPSFTIEQALMGVRVIEDFILSLCPLLDIIANIRDRSYVLVPSPERVVSHEENEDGCPYHAAPVHLAWRRARSSWEKLEKPEHREEAQRNDVDRVTGLSKVESRSWELFAANSLLEDT